MVTVNLYKNIGTYYCSNGEKYSGEWKDGKANGNGIILYYEFLGTFYYKNNEKYVGEWKDNNICGNGNEYVYNRNILLFKWKQISRGMAGSQSSW